MGVGPVGGSLLGAGFLRAAGLGPGAGGRGGPAEDVTGFWYFGGDVTEVLDADELLPTTGTLLLEENGATAGGWLEAEAGCHWKQRDNGGKNSSLQKNAFFFNGQLLLFTYCTRNHHPKEALYLTER